MDFFVSFLKNTNTLFLLISLMTISYIYQKENILTNIHNWLLSKTKLHPKISLSLLSAIAGFLPIPGRIMVCATLLESINKKHKNFGTVSYLSTHHYYMWSPIEKTVVISMSLLSLTYFEVVSYLFIPLVLYIIYFLYYLIFKFEINMNEINISSKFYNFPTEHKLSLISLLLAFIGAIFFNQIYWSFGLVTIFNFFLFMPNIIDLFKSYNYKLLLIISFVILLGLFIHQYTDQIKVIVEDFSKNTDNILLVGLIGFIGSVILGSSSRFVALTVISTLIFGIEYFVFFFMMDFAGYLISPVHKCVMIGKLFFDTPFWQYFKYIGGLALLMFGYGIFNLYFMI